MFGRNDMGPIFLKESSDLKRIEDSLNMLLKLSDAEGSNISCKIKDELAMAHVGAKGEDEIKYYLKNSGLDMIVLQDVNLEVGDLRAQIDFIVITRKKVYVIECKNLFGDIEIDSRCNWIRSHVKEGKQIREGIKSPITQNDIHLNVIKLLRQESRKNALTKEMFKKYFDTNYKSLVVLTSENSLLSISESVDDKLKDIVIRADQLTNKIKELDSTEKEINYSDKEMTQLANFFIENNKEGISPVANHLKELLDEFKEIRTLELANEFNSSPSDRCPNCGGYLKLKPVRKGERAGRYILGCSNYPNCKFIKNV